MNIKTTVKTMRFSELDSTNDYAKNLRKDGESVFVVARKQTGGRGTKGRSFSSGVGGVYLSKLTFHEDFPAKDAFLLMAGAAAAVCKTLEFYRVKPVIKWVNDIYVNDKKICGILIENVFSGSNIASSVVGIGLNINSQLPEELKGIATTLQKETGKSVPVEEVTERLIEELSRVPNMEDYLSRIGYMGKKATVVLGDERIPATLLSVDNEGGLWVEIDGKRRRFHAAEVSLNL